MDAAPFVKAPSPEDVRRDVRSEVVAIARLAAPLALAQFGLTTISLVDVAVLGHASAADLGGASIGRAVAFTGIAVPLGVAGALEPLAAQAVGANDEARAWQAFLAALRACVVIWLPTAALAGGATFLLERIGITPSLAAPARAFFLPQLPGMLAFSVFLAAKSFLQAGGRTAAALSASIAANIVNFLVCNLLVRGDGALVAIGLPAIGMPAHGAFGAGIASSISTSFLAAWMLVAAWRMRPDGEQTPLVSLTGEPGAATMTVLHLALPIGLQLLAEIGVFGLVAVLAGRLGSVAASAHQVAIGLASFTFMGALGISGATAVRVGNAVGEGRSPRRAGLVGVGLGAAYMTMTATIFLLARRPLAAVFTEDPAVIELGARLLVVAAAFQLFDGVQAVAAGALRGAADVRFSFLANVGAHWFIGLPLALWLGFRAGLGAQGLWIGLLVGLGVVVLLLLWRFVVIARGPIARA